MVDDPVGGAADQDNGAEAQHYYHLKHTFQRSQQEENLLSNISITLKSHNRDKTTFAVTQQQYNDKYFFEYCLDCAIRPKFQEIFTE